MTGTAKKVAILATDGFEEVELTKPREALNEAGIETEIVAPDQGTIRSWQTTDWGGAFDVDVKLADAAPAGYDALVLPGGVINPDALRIDDEAIGFIRGFMDGDKPVAAICHGPWTLIEAGDLKGRKITSWPSLRSDLINAGADWIDREVVVDGPLVTSRNPDDLPAFNREIVRLLQAA